MRKNRAKDTSSLEAVVFQAYCSLGNSHLNPWSSIQFGVVNFARTPLKFKYAPSLWFGMAQCKAAPKNENTSSGFPVNQMHFPKKIIIFIWIAQISLRTRRLSCRAIFFGKSINQNDCLCVQWKRGMRVGRESFSTIKIPVRIINMSLLPSLFWHNSGCAHTAHLKFLA